MNPDTSFNNQAFTSWGWEYLYLINVNKADLFERLPFLLKTRNSVLICFITVFLNIFSKTYISARLPGKFSCKHIHGKVGCGGVGTGGIGLTNTHRDLSMFLALQIELWARKRACLHRVYRPGILARQMRYRSASAQLCCNIHQWRKCCWSSRIFLLKMWFRQQHQHLLGAY